MGHQSKVTAKGQTTIPLEVREHLKLKAGDRLVYVLDVEGGVRLFTKNRPISALAGILGAPPAGAGSTIVEMDEAVGDLLAEDDDRIRREWHEGRT